MAIHLRDTWQIVEMGSRVTEVKKIHTDIIKTKRIRSPRKYSEKHADSSRHLLPLQDPFHLSALCCTPYF